MTRTANWLSNIEIDEVSLVDRPANQHARVAIAKRAPEEDLVEYYNEQGEVVEDLDALEAGEVVFDASGAAFLIEEDDTEHEQSDELVGVGKSLAEQVREDLSKALSDVERDEVISKAMGEIAKAEQRAAAAEEIAKAERELRLRREYISKAESYGVPGVTAQELGPVLMRAAESLSHEDCVVLNKALTTSGEAFRELGTSGASANHDAFGAVEALIASDSELSKALEANGANRDDVIIKAFEANPDAYDEYLRDRAGR